jgi:hypothetical protein
MKYLDWIRLLFVVAVLVALMVFGSGWPEDWSQVVGLVAGMTTFVGLLIAGTLVLKPARKVTFGLLTTGAGAAGGAAWVIAAGDDGLVPAMLGGALVAFVHFLWDSWSLDT